MLKGALFFFPVFAVAYFGGHFFYPTCLLFWLIPYGARVARKVNDFLLSLWFIVVPTVLEFLIGIKIKVCGDLKKLDGPCLIIMNHRTRFDWMFLWCYLIRMGDLTKIKIILKSSLKKLPVFGWPMQAAHFLFLSRKWENDRKIFTETLGYFLDIDYPIQLLIFPEGTDLSDSNKAKSKVFAEKNGLESYDYVLHPRTKGFVHCLKELRKGKSPPTIINMSVAYAGGGMPQGEKDIAMGKWPKEIHFFAEQIKSSDVPQDNEGISNWLKKMWSGKEQQLKEFYKKKKFDCEYLPASESTDAHSTMKTYFAFWVVFFVWLSYSFATTSFHWWYYAWATLFMLGITYLTDGIDAWVLKRHRSFHS